MIIYKVTNNVNGKIYVGLTKQKLKLRWQQHVRGAIKRPEASYFFRAIKKYGPDSFTLEVIDEAKTMNELSEKEIDWIEKLNCCDRTVGYNCKSGGINNFEVSKETRDKISKALKGKAKSEEHKKKCGLARKGKPSLHNRKNKIGYLYGFWLVVSKNYRGEGKNRKAWYEIKNINTNEKRWVRSDSLNDYKKRNKYRKNYSNSITV
jgi:group I intron endonuclease